jgi:negative regulator of flagellin synthesis FlgM
MKIDGSDPLGRLRGLLDRIQQQDQASSSRESGQGAGADGAAGASKDSVTVSSRAQELAALREAIESSPDVRRELVSKLQEEISSGRYRVDGNRIANGLLEERDLS